MKTLYLDCNMGAAGDMLTAALLELAPDPDAFLSRMEGLGIPGVMVSREACVRCGIQGTHVTVTVDGEVESEAMHVHHHDHDHDPAHHHSSMHDVETIVAGLPVTEKVRSDILAVYGLIAEAESYVHGVPVQEIHFHEVGTMDAIADVTAVCLLMEGLAPEQVIASPVHVGSGLVHCAHGILPVPAPATAHILRGVPIYGGGIECELCTPTGAALLKHFVTRFGDMPMMTVEAIGYGMGMKDLPVANCVRAMLGQTEEETGSILELCCDLDDMTPEALGYAQEALFRAGALDVYTTPVQMKKCRPGALLTVLCRPEDRDTMVRAMFQHTSTLGIREQVCRRYTLDRKIETVPTPYGEVHRKISSGYGVQREKYEYEDIAGISMREGLSFSETVRKITEVTED